MGVYITKFLRHLNPKLLPFLLLAPVIVLSILSVSYGLDKNKKGDVADESTHIVGAFPKVYGPGKTVTKSSEKKSIKAKKPASIVPTATTPKIIFGLGPEADTAAKSQLNKAAPVGMYTSWYNGTKDLVWMQNWKLFVSQIYASGRANHLVIHDPGSETGNPCGRQYSISSQINTDMKQLAQIFSGKKSGPPLYVTLFTEFQTYPCKDNNWNEASEYYTKLQIKMIEIKNIFHQYAPNAKISIGWGGWQARWDDPKIYGGKSLFKKFDSVSRKMDFQSFQAMQDDGNVEDVRQMTKILGVYGPVMVAHHKPDGFHPTIFEKDIRSAMNDRFLREVKSLGLFAWSFMDEQELDHSKTIFNLVKNAVLRYGRKP